MDLDSFTEISKIHTKIYKKWYSLTFSGNPSCVWVADSCMSDYLHMILLFFTPELKKMTCWVRIRSPALQIQIMRVFSHPRAEIYEKILHPRFVPVFRFWEWNSPPINSKMLARKRMTLEGFWKKIRNLRNRFSRMG